MSGQSGYLAKKKVELDEYMHTAERITRQFDQDTLQVTLGRYSKLNLGYKRIMEITELWEQVREEYRGALGNGTEADVKRQHLDAELLQIAKKPELVLPFEPRYPEMKKITYDRRRRK